MSEENVREEINNENNVVPVPEPVAADDTKTVSAEAGTESDVKKEDSDAKKKSFGWLIYAATFVAVCVAVVIFILMLPVNRSSLYQKMASKAFESGNFSKAFKYYSKSAEVLYYNVDSQLGTVVAAQFSREDDEKEAFYKALSEVERLVPEQINATNKKSIVELYLTAPEIVSDEVELVNILTKGYENTGKSGELINALIDACLAAGDSLYAKDREGATDYYDRALTYSSNAENVSQQVAKAVTFWIEDDVLTDDYESAKNLMEKYEVQLGNSKNELLTKLYSSEAIYNAKISVLSKAYTEMQPYFDSWKDSFSIDLRNSVSSIDFGMFARNWEEMLRLDGSQDAELLAHSGVSDRFLYSPNGITENYTGVACGLYLYDDGASYCFFMGNLVNGKREGYGYCIAKVDSTSYFGFEGIWRDDKPNGAGVFYKNNRYAYTSQVKYRFVTIGTYKDGLENGVMTVKATTNENPGSFFIGSYTAKEGIAEPISNTTGEYETDTYEDRYLICTMIDTVYGYGYYMPYFQYRDSKMEAMGY